MKAAIYVRVSTEHEEQRLSPANQIATCRDYADENGLEIYKTYNDAGKSGTEMSNRLEIQRLILDARAGKFDAVLFTSISRFARDMSDALSLKKQLEQTYSIRLVSIEEGYDSAIEGRNSEMVFSVHAMLAAHKSQEMSKAIKRGLRQSAKNGRHVGNIPPFGYAKNSEKKLVPDPKTSNVVVEIFNLYLSGLGSKSIAEILNKRKIPTYSTINGKPTLWQSATVTRILRNPVYMGTIVAQKWSKKQDVESSRKMDTKIKHLQIRDQKEWITVADAHEGLISTDTFNSVQELLDHKAANKGIKRTSNLLAGLLTCKSCGGSMIVSGRKTKNTYYRYIACSKIRRIGKFACTNHSFTNYNDLEQAILAQLRGFSKDDIGEIATKLASTSDSANSSKVDEIYRQLAQNEDEQKRNLLAFQSGLFPIELIQEEQKRLNTHADTLRNELVRLQTEEKEQNVYREKVSNIESALDIFSNLDLYDEMTKKIALRHTLDKITIDENGQIEVYWAWSI